MKFPLPLLAPALGAVLMLSGLALSPAVALTEAPASTAKDGPAAIEAMEQVDVSQTVDPIITGPVRVISRKRPLPENCDDATWPFIPAKCLTRNGDAGLSGE